MDTPQLNLSFGQLAWSLNFGETPKQYFIDKLNYLSKLGIPFNRDTKKAGSGNRVNYSYEDLMECGVAMYGLSIGLKPKDLKLLLLDRREVYRDAFRRAIINHPESVMREEWVKYKGRGYKGIINVHDVFLRLHDRYSDFSGTIDLISFESSLGNPLDFIETFPDGINRPLLPLSRLAVQWTAWALEAPEFKTGPKT